MSVHREGQEEGTSGPVHGETRDTAGHAAARAGRGAVSSHMVPSDPTQSEGAGGSESGWSTRLGQGQRVAQRREDVSPGGGARVGRGAWSSPWAPLRLQGTSPCHRGLRSEPVSLHVSGLRFGVNKAGLTWDGGPHDLRGSLRVSHSSLVEREDAPRLPLGCCPPTSVGRGQPEVGAVDRSPHQSSFVPKPCGCVPQHTHTGKFCAPLWRVTHAPPGRQPQTGPPAPLYPQSLAKQLRPSHPKRQMKRVF